MISTIAERLKFYNYACLGIKDEVFDDNEELWESLPELLSESLIKQVSKTAYKDLQRKIPYSKNSTEINKPENKELRKMKDDFKKDVEDLLYLKLAHYNSQGTDITALIKDVSDLGNNKYAKLFKTGSRFTIGMAQKWVNMTLKYLWLLGAIDGENLHAPIDRTIIRAATNKEGEWSLGIDYKYKHNKLNNWPSWDDINEYKKFQDSIRKEALNRFNYSPISWENKAWVDLAT